MMKKTICEFKKEMLDYIKNFSFEEYKIKYKIKKTIIF